MEDEQKNSSGRKDCRTEVGKLFEKLNQWREESYNHHSKIIDSHSNGIQNGINDLMVEVCELQAQLSVITKERNGLLQTTDNLRGEIRQLSAHVPITQHLAVTEENYWPYAEDTKLSNAKEQNVDGPNVSNEAKDCENTEDQKMSTQHWDKLHDSTDIQRADVKNEDVKHEETEEVHEDQEEEAHQDSKETHDECKETAGYQYRYVDSDVHKKGIRKEFKCNLCPYISLLRPRMKRHVKGVHKNIRDHKCDECGFAGVVKSELTQHKQSVHKVGGRKFECEKCPYISYKKSYLDIHIKGVHNKIRNYLCKECGLGCLQKAGLKQHMNCVHKMGDSKFKCEECPYTSFLKGSLKSHIERVHENKKNYSCEQCPFASYHKASLNLHINDVHKKIRNHACEDCGTKFLRKGSLKRHMASVHKIGGRQFKCEQCTFTSTHKSVVKTHIEGVHDKLKSNLCEVCGFAASQKTTLKKHMESAHTVV